MGLSYTEGGGRKSVSEEEEATTPTHVQGGGVNGVRGTLMCVLRIGVGHGDDREWPLNRGANRKLSQGYVYVYM